MSEPGDPRRERRGLGRGLAALFGEEEGAEGPGRGARRLPIARLKPGRMQPRVRMDGEQMRALADSVREKGVLQPLLVRAAPDEPGMFEIVAGERRWRAAQMARVHEVPAVVCELTDGEALELALVENLQRADLTPLEEAAGYSRLMEHHGHTQEEVSRLVGRSRPHVANILRLLSLPDPVKTMVDAGRLSMGHARALLNAADPGAVAEEVLRRDLNVRATERLVARQRPGRRRTARERWREKDADTLMLERELSADLGLRCAIELFRGAGDSGRLTIDFQSLEQLDALVARLRQPTPGRGPEGDGESGG